MTAAIVSFAPNGLSVATVEQARMLLAQARNVDVVKDIRDKAEALRQYAKQAGDSLDAQNYAAEIKLRAERRAGELLGEMERGKAGRPAENSRHDVGNFSDYQQALQGAGVEERTAQRWQSIAAVPEPTFEAHLQEVKASNEELTTSGVLRLAHEIKAGAIKPHVALNSGNNEWYTPSEYIASAHYVMGGIDLDPASSPTANAVVAAKLFYTADDDGLSKSWRGRVWMNPPYSSDLISLFCAKLVEHVRQQEVTEAIVLVNNATETEWFGQLVTAARAVVFPRGRVRFWKPDGETGAPLQGQAILYFGGNAAKFVNVFGGYGWGAVL